MPLRNALIVIIKLILFYLIYQLVFGGIGMAATRLIPSLSAITATSLAMIASTITMAWHLIHFGYLRLAGDRYREVTPSVLGVSIVFIFAAMYVLNLLIEQAGIPNTMDDEFIAMSRNPFGILSITLLGPILEELLFRGAIQGHLQATGLRPWQAILGAALVFGVVHMNPAQILFAFPLGAVFGWLYYRTGSLLPGLVGHLLNNSIAAINLYLYGDASLEEQMPSPLIMWFCAAVGAIVCCLAAAWLSRRLRTQG